MKMPSSVHFLLLLIFLLSPTTVLSVQPPQDGTNPPPQAYKPPASPVAKPLTPPAAPTPTPISKPPAPTPTPIIKPPTPIMEPPAQPVKPYTPPPKAPTPVPYRPPVTKEECGPLCDARCSLHSRKQVCVRACSTCCLRCKCVPPGTYGNRELCGKCYTDMLTHGDRFKCP